MDLDDARTWPPAVRGFAEHWAGILIGSVCDASDLAVPPADRETFTTLIGDEPFRVYHCTRMLDEETADIRRDGMAPLSRALVTSRIQLACAAGYLTTSEASALLSGSAIESAGTGERLGQVCAVAGRGIFDDDPVAVELLLSLWGGEAIYWAHERSRLGMRLRLLGRPSIVVLDIQLAAGSRRPSIFPDLSCLSSGASCSCRVPLPTSTITALSGRKTSQRSGSRAIASTIATPAYRASEIHRRPTG